MPISVNVSTAGGTAISGTDFSALPIPTTLTFAPGQPASTVSVPVIGDPLDEPDETFTVNLSNPVLGTILDGQGVGTIVDNDPPHPTISISDATVTEGHSGTSFAVFTVSLREPFQLPISVDVSTADGTAVAGTDYSALAIPTTLTFAPGVTSLTVSVPVIGDPFEEGDETFTVNLSNPVLGLLGDDVQGVGTIVNDDPTPPTISINDDSVMEGHSGTVQRRLHGLAVVCVHPSDLGDRLHGRRHGHLRDGLLGPPNPTTLTFAPGQTSLTVAVPVIGDMFEEADETFTVNLSNPFLGTILDGQGVGTIVNDDPTPPTISIGDATVTELESGTIIAVFTVSLSSAYIHPISVERLDGQRDGHLRAGLRPAHPDDADLRPGRHQPHGLGPGELGFRGRGRRDVHRQPLQPRPRPARRQSGRGHDRRPAARCHPPGRHELHGRAHRTAPPAADHRLRVAVQRGPGRVAAPRTPATTSSTSCDRARAAWVGRVGWASGRCDTTRPGTS